MSFRNKSTVNPDGKTVNIDFVGREISEDLAYYQKYKAEDRMKKRSIRTSKDYNEFRNFVSVSQLKPIPGREVSCLFSGKQSLSAKGSGNFAFQNRVSQERCNIVVGFETCTRRRDNKLDQHGAVEGDNIQKNDKGLQSLLLGELSSSAKNSQEKSGVFVNNKSSQSAFDFLQQLNQHSRETGSLLTFLTRLKPGDGTFEEKLALHPKEICNQYFSTEIDSNILGSVVEALHLLIQKVAKVGGNLPSADDPISMRGQHGHLHFETISDNGLSGVDYLVSQKSYVTAFIQYWLEGLKSCGRFDLSVSFLMANHQKKLKETCEFLQSFCKIAELECCDELLACYRKLLN